MTLSIISFTENGRKLSERIKQEMKEDQIQLFSKSADAQGCPPPVQPVEVSVGEWAGRQMKAGNALLFIGACGIAVRAVAPYLAGKQQDPPVLVMDERGKHVIPLLSGHIGGANELAWELAGKTGAEPVITTATDLNGKFAVDLFAKRNGLLIVNPSGIAEVSSKVLAGKEITISIETGHWKAEKCPSQEERKVEEHLPEGSRKEEKYLPEGSRKGERYLPEGIRMLPYPPDGRADVVVSSADGRFDTPLLLKPKEYVVGIGCKRGTESGKIEAFMAERLNSLHISLRQIFALASLSLKQDEQGILAWCQKERVPFLTYTAEELQEVRGDFTESAFVRSRVGIGNVCERAALKACGPGGKLISGKYAEDGMTIAVAKREWGVEFEEE